MYLNCYAAFIIFCFFPIVHENLWRRPATKSPRMRRPAHRRRHQGRFRRRPPLLRRHRGVGGLQPRQLSGLDRLERVVRLQRQLRRRQPSAVARLFTSARRRRLRRRRNGGGGGVQHGRLPGLVRLDGLDQLFGGVRGRLQGAGAGLSGGRGPLYMRGGQALCRQFQGG